MTYVLSDKNRLAIWAHAAREYPNEACGVIVAGAYRPLFNYASEPQRDFMISAEDMARAMIDGLEAIVHSHPDATAAPSARDMQSQIDTDVPWVIVATNGEDCSAPVIFGDGSIAPLVGRQFMHGVHDCYSLIRDVFRLGKENLARPEVVSLTPDTPAITTWPYDPIELPEFPRSDGWWDAGEQLYLENFGRAGFIRIAHDQAQPGDVFLISVRSETPNHGGVYIGGSMILHHLPTRVSRREPIGVWGRAVDVWLRYVGDVDA